MKKQLILPFSSQALYTVEDFIQSPSNYKAFQAVSHPAQWPQYGLIVWGAAKSGKTHLAHIFHHSTGAEFIPLERLNNFPDHDWVKENSYYILDYPCNDYRAYETKLFHFLNLLSQKQSKVLITADLAVAQWPLQLPDLKSRLSLMLSVPLEAPDDILLESILLKHAADLQITLSPHVISYLITHTDRCINQLLSLLHQLNALALEQGRKITVPLVKQLYELQK